jgi:hypothetical protein
MDLFYDERDDSGRACERLRWLEDIGARPSAECDGEAQGFLFSRSDCADDYCRLIAGRPHLEDQPGDRIPLMRILSFQETLSRAAVQLPIARAWPMTDEQELTALVYPVYLRPDRPFENDCLRLRELLNSEDEMRAALKRLDPDPGSRKMIAQSWIPLEKNEIGAVERSRIWLLDQEPYAWSQESGQVAAAPEWAILRRASERAAVCFGSRLLVMDFARLEGAGWILYEAGPGSAALSRHEEVFKSVGNALVGRRTQFREDLLGGVFA